MAASPTNEMALSPDLKDLNTALWRLATNLTTNAQLNSYVLKSELHGLQLVPANGRSPSAHLIPIRFIFFNKLDKDDKLLLAFDAFHIVKAVLPCSITDDTGIKAVHIANKRVWVPRM